MKLREFNSENSNITKKGIPALHVNQKTGLFTFNQAAQDFVGLNPGDMFKLHQDEQVPTDWYLEKVTETGFVLSKKGSNGSKEITSCNCTLARFIGESLGVTTSYRFLIAGEPTKFGKRTLHGLLYRSTE